MVSFTLDTVKFLLIYILLSPSPQRRGASSNEWTANIPVACRLVHCRQVEEKRNLKKKKFLFCYPHTLTIGLEAPVYRGFSGEGKGEGKSNEE